MDFVDWVYIIIGGYFFIMGFLGINLQVLWITMLLKIKIYDFEYLYGRTAARVMFMLIGIGIIAFHFLLF